MRRLISPLSAAVAAALSLAACATPYAPPAYPGGG